MAGSTSIEPSPLRGTPQMRHSTQTSSDPPPHLLEPPDRSEEDRSGRHHMVQASRKSIHCTSREGSPTLTREALELLRTRELYKYYKPLTTPSHTDDEDSTVAVPHDSSDDDENLRPLSTGDPVLGSLVLLAERLLKAKRVIVIFADYLREYVIADSRAAAEYYTGEYQSELEEPPKISRKRVSIRKDLFEVFLGKLSKKDTAAVDIDAEELTEKYRWKNVTRYSGLPLKSKAGTVIGLLCALYDRPRGADFDATAAYNLTFQKLSKAVMRHMEVVRGEREKKKSRKMEIALSRFIAGNFSPDKVELTKPAESTVKNESAEEEHKRLDDTRQAISKARAEKEIELWRTRGQKREAAKQAVSAASSASPGSSSIGSDTGSYFDKRSATKSPSPPPSEWPGVYGLPFKEPDRSPPLPPQEPNSDDSPPDTPERFNASFLTGKPLFSPVEEKSKTLDEPAKPQPKKPSASGSESGPLGNTPFNLAEAHRNLFMRAAELMYNAMDVDGVAFINADLEGLADFVPPGHEPVGVDLPGDGKQKRAHVGHVSSDARASKKVRDDRQQEMRKISGVLGFYDGHPHESKGPQVAKLTEDEVTLLTESWPRGCVFAYSKDPAKPVIGFAVNRTGATSDSELDHAMEENPEVVDILRRFLPKSQSVVFLPLYDFVGKVFAVGFAWTSSSCRIFRGDVEGDFMAAFCDSIMSEVSRLHVVSANVTKANFISTMSHELRSPLHGILVSCSLFGETQLDEHQKDLIGTIQGCGKTLLDTVNNVLTFTKLNNKANMRAKGERLIAERVEKDVDLAKLVEEVADASYKGFQSTNGAEVDTEADMGLKNKEHVYMMVDIDPAITQYRFDLPPGAWRRLTLNLCTNSLKYTDRGWIHVGLQFVDDPEAEEGFKRVMLTVTDSGRGMSREFVKNSLFTPFSQEHPMHSGTGLGMSIVRQLVDELDGTVNVRTTVSVGTEVTVSARFRAKPLGSQKPCVMAQAISHLPGRRVAITGFPHADCKKSEIFGTKDATANLRAFVEKTLGSIFKMELVAKNCPLEKITKEEADCIVALGGPINDRRMDSYLDDTDATKRPAVIELGGSLIGPIASHHAIQRINKHNGALMNISRPYSPRKLAQVLLYVLGHSDEVPAQISPSEALAPVEMSRQTELPTPPLEDQAEGKPRVLVVEDNPLNRKLLCTIVKKAGHPCVFAGDGQEAVEAYENRPEGFGVVIMDLQMPNMNGIEATRAIRLIEARRRTQKPAFIMTLTALSAESVKIEATRAGGNLFITKPLQPMFLREVLKTLTETGTYEEEGEEKEDEKKSGH